MEIITIWTKSPITFNGINPPLIVFFLNLFHGYEAHCQLFHFLHLFHAYEARNLKQLAVANHGGRPRWEQYYNLFLTCLCQIIKFSNSISRPEPAGVTTRRRKSAKWKQAVRPWPAPPTPWDWASTRCSSDTSRTTPGPHSFSPLSIPTPRVLNSKRCLVIREFFHRFY